MPSVLMVIGSMNTGGAETHVLSLAKGLMQKGYFVAVASAGGVYEKALAENGIPHIYAPLDSRAPHRILSSARILRKAIKTYRFDIVHAHTRLAAFALRFVRSKGRFCKVTTAHLDFKVTPLTRRLSNWGEKTLAVSEDIRRYLIKEYALSYENIRVTVNGIDTDVYSPRSGRQEDLTKTAENLALLPSREEVPNAKEKSILHVSRMDKDRAYTAFLLCDCIPDLYRRFGARLVIVGGGELFESLQQKVSAVNKLCPNAVTLTGEQENILPYLQEADLFVGVSRAALEAMACGIPTILSGNSGFLGIFRKEMTQEAARTNFCCRGTSPAGREELTASLETLLTMDESALKALGDTCRETVVKGYSLEKMVEDHCNLYRTMSPYQKKKYNKTLILGYHGFGNLGDEAVLRQLVKMLKRKDPKAGITVFSHAPKRTARDLGVSSVSRSNPFTVLVALLFAKTLYVGGGTLLQTETSRRSLGYYALVIRIAKLLGTKVVFYANGLGAFRDAPKKWQPAVASLFKGNVVVSLRDEDSFAVFEKAIAAMPHEKRPYGVLTADPAFLVSPCAKERLDDLVRDFGGRKFFVVATNGCDQGRKSLLALASGTLLAVKNGYHPVILLMQPKVDTERAKKLAKLITKESGKKPMILAPSAEEAAGLIGQSAFLISERLHPLIFSATQNTPAIAFSGKEKVARLMKTIFSPASLVDPLASGDALSYTLCRLFEEMRREERTSFHPDLTQVKKERARSEALPGEIEDALLALDTRMENQKRRRLRPKKIRKQPPI